jgi:hypothetical protein
MVSSRHVAHIGMGWITSSVWFPRVRAMTSSSMPLSLGPRDASGSPRSVPKPALHSPAPQSSRDSDGEPACRRDSVQGGFLTFRFGRERPLTCGRTLSLFADSCHRCAVSCAPDVHHGPPVNCVSSRVKTVSWARAGRGWACRVGDTWGWSYGGVGLDGLGALSVNSVLGEVSGIAGDNSLDWMTPFGWGARSAQCSKAPRAWRRDARALQELTTARSWCCW